MRGLVVLFFPVSDAMKATLWSVTASLLRYYQSSPLLAAHSCLSIYLSISLVHPSTARHGSMEFPGSAVCCMCGDHGLPGELFQCGLCRRRLQHRYMIANPLNCHKCDCNDYCINTRARSSFRYCSELYPREAAYRSCNWCLREHEGRNPLAKAVPSKRRRRDSGNTMSPSCGCSTRTAFKAEPGKPVKKIKNVKGPRRTTTNRGKVRRYKLLAEVIC